MPITGSQKALTYSFSGVMRAGAGRSGYFPAIAAFNIGGATISAAIKPSAVITDELDNVPNTATLLLRSGPNYGIEVLADSPVGYWRMDEMVGAITAVDRSGNAFNGTYNGPTLGQTGPLADGSKAALFDGTNDYIDMGDVDTLEFTNGNFSVEAWVKFTSTTTQQVIIGKSAWTATTRGWTLLQASAGSGAIRFYAVNAASAVIADVTTTSQFNDNQWHHVVVTIPSGVASSGIKIYVDGSNQSVSAAGAGGTIDNPAVPFRIGGPSDGTDPNYNWDGYIDEVAVYNSVLSATRVSAHYAARLYTTSLLQPGNEIIIGLGNLTNRIFAGHILNLREVARYRRNQKRPTVAVDCIDYSWQLDWKRVTGKGWTNTSVGTIVGDIISAFAPAFTVRTEAGLTSVDFQSNHDERVSEAISRVMKMIGGYWYVDYDRVVHVFVNPETDGNAVALDNSNTRFWDFEYAEDLSQVRSRTRVTGRASTTTATAAVGATSLAVDDTRFFSSTGGYALVGANQITYTGKSVSEGPGNLTGIPSGGAGSILISIGQGESVRVLGIQSSASGAATLTALIGTGDGYLEHSIEDGQLGDSAANQAATGDLALNSTFDKRITYKTRDIFTRSGKLISVDMTNSMTSRHITGSYKVQRVVIRDIEVTRYRYPIREVEAGANRQDLFTKLGKVLE